MAVVKDMAWRIQLSVPFDAIRNDPTYTLFMLSRPDTVGESVMFLGCPVFPVVRLFVQTDIVVTISHERLEQF